MNRYTTKRLAVSVLALAASLLAAPESRAGGNLVSGQAYGIFAAVTRPVQINIPQRPLVTLPALGGEVSDELIDLQVPGLVLSDTIKVDTVGAVDRGVGQCSSESAATLQDLHVLFTIPGVDDFIQASAVYSDSSSFGDGTEAFSVGTTVILGLRIGGKELGDLTDVEPNTVIDIPLVATVILNEQVPDEGDDGVTTSGLTVNAIHVVDNGGLLGGDVIVASSYSAVNCPFAP